MKLISISRLIATLAFATFSLSLYNGNVAANKWVFTTAYGGCGGNGMWQGSPPNIPAYSDNVSIGAQGAHCTVGQTALTVQSQEDAYCTYYTVVQCMW